MLFISWADSIVDCVLVFRNCLSASSLHPLTWKLPSCQKIIQQIGQNQNIANVTQKYCKSNFLTQMNFIPPDVHKEKATVYLNVCQDLSFGPRKFTLSQILWSVFYLLNFSIFSQCGVVFYLKRNLGGKGSRNAISVDIKQIYALTYFFPKRTIF